jgi:hypothetical protein
MADFTPIDAAAFRSGAARGRKRGPHALSAEFDSERHRIVIRLDTGMELSFDPRKAFGLEKATAGDLAGLSVEGAGGSLHFPKLDVFLSIPRLLEGFLGPMDWTRRQARAAASRENGKLGGRPRKTPATAAA